MTKPLLIIKTGATFEPTRALRGDFEDWITTALPEGAQSVVCNVLQGETLPEPFDVCGAVITGSHAMVTDNPAWLHPVKNWLQSAHQHLPLLGICFGHQLLAATLGGEAGFHPSGPEVGSFAVTLTEHGQTDPILGALPSTFTAHLTHHQSALRLPPAATVLATNDHEPHQAFRLGESTWGVQFHPEFNEAVMADYIEAQRGVLAEHQADADTLLASIQVSPAARLLAEFYRFSAKKA